MEKIEFYIFEGELWYISDGKSAKLEETDTVAIQRILSVIRECYPSAYKALESCYKESSSNVPYYQFLMVRRFCKCNFGVLDSTRHDVDDFRFNFERVQCPLRGECIFEGKICNPKISTSLSNAEYRVMNLYYKGFDKDEIAEKLFISPQTVKNHIKSSYAKLNIHEKAEFVKYASEHHIFDEQL